MSGLLGLLILGGLFGADFIEGNKQAVDSQYARKNAQLKGKDMYYDGFHNLHWTENNEVLDEIKIGGVTEYRGTRSGTVYKREKSKAFSEAENQKEKLENAIKYCKENGIEYLPFHFPVDISRNSPKCTGIEINTGKKYFCDRNRYGCILMYLEDEPHVSAGTYGKRKYYDAKHDATKDMHREYKKSITNATYKVQEVREERTYDDKANTIVYYTRVYKISEDEYEKRMKEVDDFPYECYDLWNY